MLPKKNRIRKNADFGVICRYGKAFSCDGVILRVRKSESGVLRLGISVGVKVFSGAVVRNRIRRQIREFFRINMEKIQPGWDVVVIVLKSVNKVNHPIEEVKKGLMKSGLINKSISNYKKQLEQTKNDIFI